MLKAGFDRPGATRIKRLRKERTRTRLTNIWINHVKSSLIDDPYFESWLDCATRATEGRPCPPPVNWPWPGFLPALGLHSTEASAVPPVPVLPEGISE
jgi:hypothetical protein